MGKKEKRGRAKWGRCRINKLEEKPTSMLVLQLFSVWPLMC